MGFKLGVMVGMGVGYYLGTKATPEQRAQVDDWVRKARESEFGELAIDKAKAVADLGLERARDAFGSP
jgi:hypothetical protein